MAGDQKPRVLLIVNPAASSVKAKMRASVERELAGHDLVVSETESRDHATDLARKAAADGVDAVLTLGGDGTLNEAANGLIGSDTALCPLPGGSTNVFARTIGLPKKAGKAAAQVARALESGSVRSMGLGKANGRYFMFNAGIGFDAAVVAQVERRPKMKRRIGQGIFVYAAFATWLRHYSHKQPHFSIEFGDGSVVEDGYFSICLNSNPYTFLGPKPLNVAPGMSSEKGLTMVTLETLKVGPLLGVTRRALGSGEKVARHKKVDRHDEVRSMTVVARDTVPFQVDGDYLGAVQRITITHEPNVLTVLVP